ncbi:hypothetical protein GTP91_16590 [Rugamonas sp. FT82W]|uniref:Uncharacterized protein n=1 Tax=Duganella vulcania TaxID=2692166 RepID=A0A845G776_9BURK|nr:hypothetical protein [Duganella vulcania]MYM88787.1 hypothetical protein [Duganella vulcania]
MKKIASKVGDLLVEGGKAYLEEEKLKKLRKENYEKCISQGGSHDYCKPMLTQNIILAPPPKKITS